MRKSLTPLLIFIVVSFGAKAQEYLRASDSLIVSINEFQEKLITHRFKEKQTMYSLSKFYGLKINEIYYYNPELNGKEPRIGQTMKIPIPNRVIVRTRDTKFTLKQHAALYYIVQKDDGLKKIAEGLFNTPADTIRKRNKMTNDNLKIGQKILIGWISTKGISIEERVGTKTPALLRTLYHLKAQHQSESIGKKTQLRSGVAFWQKDTKVGGELYALHRDCPVNTILLVHNPVTKKTIYAKVIGTIPSSVYDNNVEVIVSSRVAKLLGSPDAKFFVKVKYYK